MGELGHRRELRPPGHRSDDISSKKGEVWSTVQNETVARMWGKERGSAGVLPPPHKEGVALISQQNGGRNL